MVRFCSRKSGRFLPNKARIGKSVNKLGAFVHAIWASICGYGFGRRELFRAIKYFRLKPSWDEWLHLEEEYSKTGRKR